MEGLTFYAAANFWAGVLYGCMILLALFGEWAREERKSKPAEVIQLVIDVEELKLAA